MNSDTHHHPIISLSDVSMTYDRREVLHDVNLDIGKGDFLAITGPNGGGKTTLLRIILRLISPTCGAVTYHGDNGEALRFGYLPQKNSIDSRFPITVSEVVAQGLQLGAMGRLNAGQREQVNEELRRVGIESLARQAIGSLSGGQLQRVLLARAIISRPQVLVLDEPLSYLDKSFESTFYNILEQYAPTMTIVLVSHEMSTISQMATRHLIVDGSLRECQAHHHYVHTECE